MKAGDQAGRLAADMESLALYRQAMEAYTRVRGDDWWPIERSRLEHKIGQAFYRLGDFSQARTYLTYSLAHLSETLPVSRTGWVHYGSAQAASTLAIAFDMFGQGALAEKYYRLALSYSRQVVPYRPVFQLESNRSIHHNLHGDFEKSLEHGFRAAEIARSTGNLRAWGNAMQLITWAQSFNSMIGKAFKTSQEMIVVAEVGSDRQVLCWGLLCLGYIQKILGQIDTAVASLQRAIAIAEELPDYYTHVRRVCVEPQLLGQGRIGAGDFCG